MKRILLFLLLMLIPLNVYGQANVSIIENTIYETDVYITAITTTDTANDELLRIPMYGAAGIILSIACDGDTSDDFDIYLYDYDMDGSSTNQTWHSASNRDDETILIYSYSSSITSWRDDDPIPFTCDDTTYTKSLYIGAYNDDNTASTPDIDCKIKYVIRGNHDYGAVTQ